MAREQWDIQATDPGASSLSIFVAAAQSFQGRLIFHCLKSSLVAQTVKSLLAMWETWVRSLGWEDPLEKEMATTPVFLPGKSHGQRTRQATVLGVTQSDMTEQPTPCTTMYYVSLKIFVILGELQNG